MKKTLSAILVAVIVAASLSFSVSAEEEFVITDGVLEKYNGIAAEVVIPDGVVALGDLAFDGNPTVEKICVPDTVETIGYSSFHSCANLRELHLGSSVSKIGDNAIWQSYSLTVITVDGDNPYLTAVDNVVYSKDLSTLVLFPGGFSGEFVIPDHVTKVGDYSFFGCKNITSLIIPGSVTEIGSHGLWGLSGIENIDLPDGITKIAEKTFCECSSLKALYIPDGVKEIGSRALWNCNALETIHLPDSLITLADNVFYACPLTSVTIPAGTETIGNRAFIQCDSLEKIIFEGDAPSNTDKRFIFKCDKAKIYYNKGASGFTGASFSSYDKATFSDCETGHYYRYVSQADTGNVPCGGFLKDLYRCARCEREMFKTTDAVREHDFGENGGAEVCSRCGEKNPAYNPQGPQISFTDVKPGAFYSEAVEWALANGITKGTSDTTFSPGKGCTRAEVVTFLWRAAGEPEPATGKTGFTDVKKTGFYYKAVLWAVENGVTNGISKTAFDPGGMCTRGQIVTFLYRYAGSPAADKSHSKFTDVKKGAFYEAAVAWAVAENITTGTGATAFSPDSVCTRAQTVTFLYRLAKNV